MTNLTSVLKYLEQERNRVGAQLERLNHALSVLIGTSNRRARRTISAAGRARIAAAQRARWGKGQGAKGYFNPCPQGTCDFPSRPQEDCRSAESALGQVAEGAQGVDSSRPRAMGV